MLFTNPVISFASAIRVRSVRQNHVLKRHTEVNSLALKLREEVSQLWYLQNEALKDPRAKRQKFNQCLRERINEHQSKALLIAVELHDDYKIEVPDSIFQAIHNKRDLKSAMFWAYTLAEQNTGWRITLAQYKAFIKK